MEVFKDKDLEFAPIAINTYILKKRTTEEQLLLAEILKNYDYNFFILNQILDKNYLENLTIKDHIAKLEDCYKAISLQKAKRNKQKEVNMNHQKRVENIESIEEFGEGSRCN